MLRYEAAALIAPLGQVSADHAAAHAVCRCRQVQEKTVFDDEAEVRRERAAKRAAEDSERLKGAEQKPTT